MNKHRNYSQKGGLGFGDAIKVDLLKLRHITDIDIIRLLLSDVKAFRILSDTSMHAIVLECIMDNYDLTMDDMSKTPLPPVKSFCLKLGFTHPDITTRLEEYRRGSMFYPPIRPCPILPAKAQAEGKIQKRLWSLFPGSTFVPDVIAHSPLTLGQFKEMFEIILKNDPNDPNYHRFVEVMDNNVHVVGTPQHIYDYVVRQLQHHRDLQVYVILMELIKFKPGQTRTSRNLQVFQPLHRFTEGSRSRIDFALRVAAQLTLMAAKGKVVSHDTHSNNVMGITDDTKKYSDGSTMFDDSKTFVYDLGGAYDMTQQADKKSLNELFSDLCRSALLSSRDATVNSERLVADMQPDKKTNEAVLLKNGICIEELCKFFGVKFTDKQNSIALLLESFENEVHHCITMFGKKSKNKPLDVHRRLMMIAFIDFMYNRTQEHPYCQCGEILKEVYPEQKGSKTIFGVNITSPFKDFRSFLTAFNLLELPVGNLLEDVVTDIEDILNPDEGITGRSPENSSSTLSSVHTRGLKRSLKKPHISDTEQQSSAASHHHKETPSRLSRIVSWRPWNRGGTRKIKSIRIRKSRRNGKILH